MAGGLAFVRVLVDVADVLHRQPKHGVFGAVQTDGSDSLPPSCLVAVNINSASHVSVLHVELGGPDNYVLPSESKEGRKHVGVTN